MHTKNPVDQRIIEANDRFRANFKYLMKLAETNICEVADACGCATKTIYRYLDTAERECHPKFLTLSNILFYMAVKNGREAIFMQAWRSIVGENVPMTFESLFYIYKAALAEDESQ